MHIVDVHLRTILPTYEKSEMTNLSADCPLSDPKEDKFGYASFAENIAESVCQYSEKDCLVLALHGSWGSGKTTVLNYVQHYLEDCPEPPIQVKFNPWWFSGQNNLALTFLGQLQSALLGKSEKFNEVGDLLLDYAGEIGRIADLAGISAGFGGWFGNLLQRIRRKPKSVQDIKQSIAGILERETKKILVVIDDIDRLNPEETGQLFTVIRALADFPNIIYFLAFDRKVAVEAIEEQSGLPGERFLDKIIQVPIEMPTVDRLVLRNELTSRLDIILANPSEKLIDQSYWTNVYFDGIDKLIQVPRDVIRLANTLAVTYPPLRGEVNPVDFIALESLRVFQSHVYNVIRKNPGKFCGESQSDLPDGSKSHMEILEYALSEVPEEIRPSIQRVLIRIFPAIVSSDVELFEIEEFRRNLRVCHPDMFQIYFKFALPLAVASRAEMMELVELTKSPEKFGRALVEAKNFRNSDGSSKARMMIELLIEHVVQDIPNDHFTSAIKAIFEVGDLLGDSEFERGMFQFDNLYLVAHLGFLLLKRVETYDRADALMEAITSGAAVATQLCLLQKLSNAPVEIQLLTEEEVEGLKMVWLDKIQSYSEKVGFVHDPELPRILYAWRDWGNESEVKSWCDQTTESDEGLLSFLQAFLSHTISQTFGDHAVQSQPRIYITKLEKYIDISACARRLRSLQDDGKVPADAQETVSHFLREYDALQQGTYSDEFGEFDD